MGDGGNNNPYALSQNGFPSATLNPSINNQNYFGQNNQAKFSE